MINATGKKRLARHTTRVVIYGGLGNQLFGWALATHLQTSGADAEILQAREGLGNKTHGVSATEYLAFGFNGHVGTLAPYSHLILSLARRIRFVARILRVYFTDSPGVSATTLQRSNARWVVGYHQHFSPSQMLTPQQVALGVVFSPARPSEAPAPEAKAGRRPYVAVHVRAGDLRYLRKTAGLLTPGYFVSAVEFLFSRYDILASIEVSIVSDDDEAALEVCDALRKKGFSASISGTANTSLSAAFEVLSRADYVVLSNSSFSYWAAIVGKPKMVAYPCPWRADGKEAFPVPTNESWTAIQSNWSQSQDRPAGSAE